MVPKNSSLKDKMEYVIPDGTYKGVTDGYWILIKSLPASKAPYRLRFSATGEKSAKSNQCSNAGEYEIMVEHLPLIHLPARRTSTCIFAHSILSKLHP